MTQSHRSIVVFAAASVATLLLSGAQADAPRGGLLQELDWRSIGPLRGGRTHAVAGVPNERATFYVGAVNGGVWKTDDAGRTWHSVFDQQPTQSIGAIAVAASNPDVVYVGTGEGLARPDLSIGDGVYRSPDGGRTWQHRGLADAQQVAALAVDPHDANRLFAAVGGHPFGPSDERGIYRSTDGGQTWERVLFRDENTGGYSVAIDPKHPNVVYASLWEARLGPWEDHNEFIGTRGGLFKSTDGGTTWRQLSAGLPGNVSQVNVEVAPSMPERVFAMVATTDPGDYASSAGLGLYRSDDSGEHWARITEDPRAALRIGGGDLASVRVDPTNADVVYSASIVTMKSSDGGRTWRTLRGAPGGDDYQDLWISPLDPRIIALVSDQGALVTLNGGETWSSWFNQSTAQLWHIGITPTFPYRVCSGQQDSGSVCVSSRGNDGEITDREWHPVGAIEYAFIAPDPLDADIIYGAGRNEVSKFHVSTGQVQNVTPIPVRGPDVRVNRTQPLLFSPFDAHVLYYASNVLFRTRDGGVSWDTISPDLTRKDPGAPASVGKLFNPDADHQRGVIYALATSTRSAGTLWAGTDDGLVWVTRDDGAHWADVTPPALTPWSKVTQVEASHFDGDTAYVSVSRFRIDDTHPYIYRTRDGGKSWQLITTGLPGDAAVNAVREDTVRRGLLFAATEKAVWVSFDDGDHWESLQANLPHTSMRDLRIEDKDLIVATHGRGFWILDDIARLRQAPATPATEPVLLRPSRAFRVPRGTWSDTPIPPDEPLATNPPSGAVVEYLLPREPKGTLTLEILDAGGKLVRRYSSDDQPAKSAEERDRQLIPTYWDAPFRALPKGAGMHRWVWDLHYPAPAALTRGYPGSATPGGTPYSPEGPVALPGDYLVRLTVEGKHYEAKLTVEQDPRVRLSAGALEHQLALAMDLGDVLGESSRAVQAARSVREQLKAAVAKGGTLGEQANALDARIAALLEKKGDAGTSLLLPEIQGRVASLYENVTRGDGEPTAALRGAATTATGDARRLLATWHGIEGDLPRLNAQLRRARLAPLRPETAPPRDLSEADEE